MIKRCDPVDGQQWTDGLQHYSDDGTYCVNNRGQDLVVFVGLLPHKSQQDQTAEIERRLAAVIKQNEQAQRYVSDANEAINEKTAEINKLKAERQTEFTAAQQLRSENESLAVRLQRAEIVAAEALQKWETTEQVCLKIITAFTGVRS